MQELPTESTPASGSPIADLGKPLFVIDAGVSAELLLQDYFSKLSLDDLNTMQAILMKYRPRDVIELA